MQNQNKPQQQQQQQQQQRNIPSTISDQDILFAMDSDQSPDNTVWVSQNYQDIQLSSDELDHIMNDANDPPPTFHRHPAQSTPMSAPSNFRQFPLRSASSQPSHSNVQHKEQLHQITPTTLSQSHHSHTHQLATQHHHQSQNLPPHPPTSHMSPVQTPQQQHHHRIMLPPHQFHSASLPHPHVLLPQHLSAASQQDCPPHLNQPFSLPQTISASFPTKQEPSLSPSIPHYFASSQHQVLPNLPHYHSPQQVLPLQSDPRPLDRDIYLRRSAFKADQAKLVHRTQLKQEQRQKEAEAEARGSPLTAKDKERERSRRESAVTRKRAEVYISELERVSRRLPEVEQQLRSAEAELQRLRRTIADFQLHTRQSQQITTMLAPSTQAEVKSEPSLTLSPGSERTTTVMTRMQQLDLRLPDTSEGE